MDFFPPRSLRWLPVMGFLHVLGLSAQRSREGCVDVCVLTWQVLLGGVGSGLRACGHLHLRAEHGGCGLGTLLSGRGSARPPRGAGAAAPVST